MKNRIPLPPRGLKTQAQLNLDFVQRRFPVGARVIMRGTSFDSESGYVEYRTPATVTGHFDATPEHPYDHIHIVTDEGRNLTVVESLIKLSA